MKKIIVLITFHFSLCITLHAQDRNPYILNVHFAVLEDSKSIRKIPLFDRNEIKSRKVHYAYRIHCDSLSSNNLDFCIGDTVQRFGFDTLGRLIEVVDFFDIPGPKDYESVRLDSSGYAIERTTFTQRPNSVPKIKSVKIDESSFTSVRRDIGNNGEVVLTKTTFYKFPDGRDTLSIEFSRIDKNGNVFEIESRSIDKRRDFLGDIARDLTYHYEYNYDKSNRLVKVTDLRRGTYETVNYYHNGLVKEKFLSSTGGFLESYPVQFLEESSGVIQTLEGGVHRVYTPIEDGSKLYKLITTLNTNSIPTLSYVKIAYVFY